MAKFRSLLLVAAAASAVFADDRSDLATLLPPDTAVYMESRNPTPEEMKKMAVFACLEDPQLKAVIERISNDEESIFSRTFPVGPGLVGMTTDLSELRAKVRWVDASGEREMLVQNRFAIAWVGMAEGKVPVDLVVGLEVAENAAAAVELLQRMAAAGAIALRGEQGHGVTVEQEMKRLFTSATHGGVTYAHGSLDGFHLFIVPVGTLVVVTTTEARARDVIDRSQKRDAPTLASSPRFRASLDRATGTGTPATVFTVSVDRIFDLIGSKFPGPVAMARTGMAQVGLGGLKGLSHVARVDGAGISSTTSILIEGERRGLARLFEKGEPARYGGLDFAPKDSLYVLSGNCSPRALYDMAFELGGMYVGMAQQNIERRFGIRLKEDLLDLMGPEATFIVSPNRGLIPDVGIVFESPDAARLQKTILKLLEQLPWPSESGPRKFSIGGQPVYAIPLGHPRLAEIPIAPTFGVIDGRLLITLFPLSYQRFAAVQRGERASLAKNRDFAGLRSHIPAEAMSMSYLDLARMMEFFYDTVMPLLQGLPQSEGMAALIELPDVEVLSRHLYGRIAWRTADERGLHWSSHGSLDLSGLAIGAAMGGAGVAMLLYRSALEEAEPVPPPQQSAESDRARELRLQVQADKNRVRVLFARIRLYRQEHGRMPDDLEALRAKHLGAEAFIVPGTDRSYVYLGPEGRVVLHGHPNGPDGGVWALVRTKRGLEPRRISAAELEQLLKSARGSKRR